MILEVTLIGPLLQVVSLIIFAVSFGVVNGHNVSGEAFITRPDLPTPITPATWMHALVGIDIALLALSAVYQMNNQIILPRRFQRILFHSSTILANLLFSTHVILLMTGHLISAISVCFLSSVSELLGYSTFYLSKKYRSMEEKSREKEWRFNFRVFYFFIMSLPLSAHTALLFFIALITLVQDMNLGGTNQIISELGFLLVSSSAFFLFKDTQIACTSLLLILTQVTKMMSSLDVDEPWTAPELTVLASFVIVCLLSVVGATFDVVNIVKLFKKEHPDDGVKKEKKENRSRSKKRKGKKGYELKNEDECESCSPDVVFDGTRSVDIENWRKECLQGL